MSGSAEEDNHELEEVGTESDAPTERMALDPEINFKGLHHTVRTTRKLIPPVTNGVVEKSKLQNKEKTGRKVKLPYREFASQSSQTEGREHKKSRTYKFVHSDGRVDIVTDMMTKRPEQRRGSGHDRRSRSKESDDGDYLTPSESETEDLVGVSHAPVSVDIRSLD